MLRLLPRPSRFRASHVMLQKRKGLVQQEFYQDLRDLERQSVKPQPLSENSHLSDVSLTTSCENYAIGLIGVLFGL